MHDWAGLLCSIDIIIYVYIDLQIDMSGQYSCMNRLLSSLQTNSDIYIYRQTWQDNIHSTYIHNQIQIDISPRYSNEPDSDVCIIPRSQTSQCASHRGMSQVIKSYEKFFFFNSAAHTAESAPNTPAGPLINRLKRSFEHAKVQIRVSAQSWTTRTPSFSIQ